MNKEIEQAIIGYNKEKEILADKLGTTTEEDIYVRGGIRTRLKEIDKSILELLTPPKENK